MGKLVKEYTNSVQHNVIATVINNLNKTTGLTYLNKNENENFKVVKNNQISVLHGMNDILNGIHALGYKIVKG